MTDEELCVLEAEVCDLLGIEPTKIVYAILHEGQTFLFNFSDDRELVEGHLGAIQRRHPDWMNADVITIKHYPPIAHDTSEGWSAMRLVVKGMEAKGYSCQVHFHVVDDESVWVEFVKDCACEVGYGDSTTIPLAVTLAAKDALSKEAQKG